MRLLCATFALLVFVLGAVAAPSGDPYSERHMATFADVLTTPPTVVTGNPDLVTQTGARLNGTANPNGFSTTANFQYGTTVSYGTTTLNQSVGAGTGNVAVQQNITGLLPHTTYHYMLSATSSEGTDNGADKAFTTLAFAPVVILDTPVTITSGGATFMASVNPNGAATTVHFEYGLTSSYGTSTANQSIGSDTTAGTVSKAVTGLSFSTLYHVRVVAVNNGGTSTSGDMVFTTLPPLPTVRTRQTTEVTLTSATLNAVGNALGSTGTVWFDWGTSPGTYPNSTPTSALGGATGDQFFSAALSGLIPGTTYHYRGMISTSAGDSSGNDRYFTTLVTSREYAPDSNTMLLFHLDEGDAQYNQDYSAHGLDAVSSGPFVTQGKYGNGRHLYAGSDFLMVPSESAYDFPDGVFTLEGWIYPNLSGLGSFVMFNHGNSAAPSYRLTVTGDGNVDLLLSRDGTLASAFHAVTAGAPVTDNTWHHVAASVDLSIGLVTIYVDGIIAAVTTTGTMPTSLFSTQDPFIIGLDHAALNQKTKPKPLLRSAEVVLDEIRISHSARTRQELRVGGLISGRVFNDIDADSKPDSSEPGIPGWQIVLLAASGKYDATVVSTVATDLNGNFSFDGLTDGAYLLKEVQEEEWIQTAPRGNGLHTIIIKNGSVSDNNLFGNVMGCRYIGPPGGNWNSPGHWSCGHVPTSEDPIIVPNDTSVLVDALPLDSISALRIHSGGSLNFGSLGKKLKIRGIVRIDSGGTMSFPDIFDGTGVQCTGDWLNFGSFSPGKSTVVFSGNQAKTIFYYPGSSPVQGKNHPRTTQGAVAGNQFYNLVVNGDSTMSAGNLFIQNQLSLNYPLTPQPDDTIFVLSDSAVAVTGSGGVPRGTLNRSIHAGSNGVYRFESGYTTLQFGNGGSYPGTVTERPQPGATPRSWQLYWQPVGGTVDLVHHAVTATNVNHFSNWTIGKPGGTIKPIAHLHSTQDLVSGFDTTNTIKRIYTIDPDANNGNFDATVSLRYDASEVGSLMNETGLQLYRGPFLLDSVRQGWNLVSLPMTLADSTTANVFPSAISSAFRYSNSYQTVAALTPGVGYWVKLPAAGLDTLFGGDVEAVTVSVSAGWNMIGSLSYPTTPANITSSDGVTFGNVFGYKKGYYSTSTLEPLQGYWVKASQAGHLTISAPPLSAMAPATRSTGATQSVDAMDQLARLIVTDREGCTQTLYYGALEAGTRQTMEMPPPPPAGIFDARFTGDLMAALSPAEGAKKYALTISAAHYPVTLRWERGNGSPSGSLTVNGGNPYSLSKNGSLVLNDAAAAITVTMNAAQGGAENSLPHQYALYQNYPNPFNPQTTIGFDLPAAGSVTLRIYNLLGQQIATLADNQHFEAGSFRVPFNAGNMASGVYFYRITAGNGFTAVRSMMILK